jgi:hypothetical protein
MILPLLALSYAVLLLQYMRACALTFVTMGGLIPKVHPECVQQKPLITVISILGRGQGRSHLRCREDHKDHKVL